MPPGCFGWLFEQLFRTASKFFCKGNSTTACYSLRSLWDFKWTKSKLYERNISSFSKSNPQKIQSLCSFLKYNKVWKQKLKVKWGTRKKLIAWKYHVNITSTKSNTKINILWKICEAINVNVIYVFKYTLIEIHFIKSLRILM